MRGVSILRGPAHVIAYQSELFKELVGCLEGIPVREAFADPCGHGRFLPYFDLLDRVYETGTAIEVAEPSGTLLFVRLADHSGVGVHYEQPSRLHLPWWGQASLRRELALTSALDVFEQWPIPRPI